MKPKIPKLIPCPFCGGRVVFSFNKAIGWHNGVECKKCGLNAYFFDNGYNVASIAGGTRADEKRAIAKRWNAKAVQKFQRKGS